MTLRRPALSLALLACLPVAAMAQQDPPVTIDTHVDIPATYMRTAQFDVGKDTPLRVDLGKMERGGLNAAFFIIYVEQGPLTKAGYAKALAQATQKYDDIDLMLTKYPDRIRLARTPEQVMANRKAGVLSAMIGIENGYSLGHQLGNLDKAFARGARYIGITHVGNNDLCTSSMPEADLGDAPLAETGLTPFGHSVVTRANQLGIMVDVSHSSDACVRDVLKATKAPIIASHSGAHAIVNHPRNLPDDLLRAIAQNGGVVQAVAYKGFLKLDPGRELAEKALAAQVTKAAGDKQYDSDKIDFLPAYVEGMRKIDAAFPLPNLDDYIKQIRHMVGVAGIDHVGLASDFDGGGGIDGWQNAEQTRNVTEALRKHGFSDDDIAKLWGGNLLRVWKQVDDVAAKEGKNP
ncbi:MULTISPECIES: dipeptidase [Dyella]|uniref:Membrane dipeptidase n=2 Tax=Dyella TaxID=231454 RepID=A0A4R0YP16_9GAMM|nr:MULTISPECIES: dipeptidase [Dyella]TBR36823.1 membrane dipeptidase [Dyella terrae]TCI08086.1 membrane dipeptidase [Dyella soli]